MASMKEINLRIKSITGTRQITKAMELVAISKLSKARERTERCRPFYNELYQALCDISTTSTAKDSPYCQAREAKKSCIIVIAGDRGLAGGYNNNLFKLFEELSADKNVCVLPIGKRSVDYCTRKGYEIISSEYSSVEDIDVGDCFEIAGSLCEMFSECTFDELYVVYTNFASMLTQDPGTLKILPLDASISANTSDNHRFMLVEPGAEAVFNSIVPDSVAGLIWGTVCESFTSELAARRTAMESATSNADDIIADLQLKYNKARKSSITQQITEIVSGAGAE
ncbi:MAG: ATP synthase F1 subunit gamma [Oscillospiraceae bacterium]|nr:ATP synthase F1 subunit gamma [Oscillospiraceae bacterium]